MATTKNTQNKKSNSTSSKTTKSSGTRGGSTKKTSSSRAANMRSASSRNTRVPSSVRESGRTSRKTRESMDPRMKRDLIFWGMLVVVVVLFLSLIGTIKGIVGEAIKSFILGTFGLLGFVMPFLLFIAIWLIVANKDNLVSLAKIVAGIVLVFLLGIFIALVPTNIKDIAAGSDTVKVLYELKSGGGVIFGGLAVGLVKLLGGRAGSIALDVLLMILCCFLIAGKSVVDFFNSLADKALYRDEEEEDDGQGVLALQGKRLEALVDKNYEKSKDKMKALREQREIKKEEYDKKREADKEAKRIREQEKAKEKERKDDNRIVNNSNNFNMEKMRVVDKKVQPENNDDMHSISIVPGTTEELTEASMYLGGIAPSQANVHVVNKYQSIEEVNPGEFGDGSVAVTNNININRPESQPEPKIHSAQNEEPKAEFESKDISATNSVIKTEPKADLKAEKKEKQKEQDKVVTPTDNMEPPVPVVSKAPIEKSKDLVPVQDKPQLNPDGSTHVFQINDTPMDIPASVTTGVAIKPYDTTGGPDLRITSMPEPVTEKSHKTANAVNAEAIDSQIKKVVHKRSDYKAPDINLLKRNDKKGEGDSNSYLKETALKLQDTLKVFGVGASVTDISQGPSVTRYELSLDTGVKVNKILNLQEDLKLNMAAEDIRIEAPIPGKAAVGIELPNKEATPVLIRDLVDSPDFKASKSNLTFGIGKDISGKTIVGDIAKMPHMLIAGSTGSGKSVCINTIIMSILYKAHPDDVKLIMVDPKVVELSVYNGIPHLMIPVVTDPKKASAALAWAVAEMTKRYNSFAEYGVRDLAGFNDKVEALRKDNPEAPEKLPQIVVIVDELADLMMVASKEVEESICRLAQLARAAGIHLIIATQRPSADVITGLIKANMPSKIAFRVASGIDSRIILDSVGAERLLGKGDMLYYPQGFSKPLRVQGCFVSDKEVTEVVDFLVKNNSGYATENIEASKITEYTKADASGSQDGGKDNESSVDEFFVDACKAVVKKGTASSGNLQRMFRIGFNRAARMIDQMESYGIVGPEQGTKPRQVLVSEMELEQILSTIK